MRRIQGWLFPIVIILLFSACSNLKYLPEGSRLYTGATVEVKDSNLTRKQRKSLESELQALTRPRPNKKFLGMRIKLTAYNIAGNPKKEKSPAGLLKNKIGEPPVLVNELNVDFNEQVLESNLQNQGYFKSTVTGDTTLTEKTGHVTYSAFTGPQYKIKEVHFPGDSVGIDQKIREVSGYSLLKPGDPFNLDVIKSERDRIDAYLKEQGYYYFGPDLLIVDADSTEGAYQVNLFVHTKSDSPAPALVPYHINDIYVTTDYSLRNESDTSWNKAKEFQGVKVRDRRNRFDPRLFRNTILFHTGDLYTRTRHNRTLNRLITLGTFRFVKNRFEAVPGADSAVLNSYYYLTPSPKKSLQVEVNANTKSNNLTGSQLTIGWKNRNTFKRAELFTIDATGGFEVQYSGQFRGYNTYRGGIEANLLFPRFVIPFVKWNTTGGFVPNTNVKLGYDLLNKNKLYTLNSFRAALEYSWKESAFKEHKVAPININYVQPINVTQEYIDSAAKNPLLNKAIEEQFILGSAYTFTYNPINTGVFRTGLYFMGNVDISGNVAGLVSGANVKDGKQVNIFGAPFSQYIKGEADIRYYIQTGKQSAWANRLILGLGYPYGNSTSLPFIKQFFIGGNNSIRAFRSRSLGPGSYIGPNYGTAAFLPDQSGDIKMELNSELRGRLFSIVHGALFVDAGNIWLYNADSTRPGAQFSKDFLNEFAVGAGAGIRFDISFLVLRLDLAIPLRKPFLEPGKRWVIDQINFSDATWRKQNIIFNLAIGYPF